jgi:hypothetical protein
MFGRKFSEKIGHAQSSDCACEPVSQGQLGSLSRALLRVMTLIRNDPAFLSFKFLPIFPDLMRSYGPLCRLHCTFLLLLIITALLLPSSRAFLLFPQRSKFRSLISVDNIVATSNNLLASRSGIGGPSQPADPQAQFMKLTQSIEMHGIPLRRIVDSNLDSFASFVLTAINHLY